MFDCAASQGGISLNNQCYQGPDLNNKLIDVLLRFRLYKYAIMADVEAMYLQVKIPPKDRNALRFLWDVNGQTRHFRMTSHLFGGVWCASSSTYALRRTVDDAGASRLVEDTVKRGFYVDDMLKSVHDVGDVSDVMHGTKQVLSYGGFNLTKVVINDSELLEEVKLEDRAAEVRGITPEMLSRALGMKWDVKEDIFFYVNKPMANSAGVTRRSILSRVLSMYDPIGLISPIILRGRRIFQDTTRLKLKWDVGSKAHFAGG